DREHPGADLERVTAPTRIRRERCCAERVADSVVPQVVEWMPRREAGDGGDRNRAEQQRHRLKCKPGRDDREAERRREAQPDPQRAMLGIGEAVTLRLEVASEPGLHCLLDYAARVLVDAWPASRHSGQPMSSR